MSPPTRNLLVNTGIILRGPSKRHRNSCDLSFGEGLHSPSAWYGATFEDGAHGHGNVFKLTPANGGWTYTSLYNFTGGSDGSWPNSRLVIDASGNVFGTTQSGGQN